MPEPLKDMFNPTSLRQFALAIQSVCGSFKVEEFLESTLDETWDSLELLARGRQISTNLGRFLPQDYRAAIGVFDQVVPTYDGPGLFCIPDFVEIYGQEEDDWDFSVAALGRYTQYASSELAVRPFIIKHEDRMMAQMYAWSKDENEHLRRLASEGCRPQLPWAPALTSFKQDPTPILPILEQLKADPSQYVRRSVANNLNDISKTHPDLVVKLAQDWFGENEDTNWIVKHACRTLLKQANREVLAIFGFLGAESIVVEGFELGTQSVQLGGDLVFSFEIAAKAPTKVRLEYAIDYVKANGKRNRKIFQISELSLKTGDKRQYNKTQSFADMSTRKHYPGTHSITLITNGAEREAHDFEVTE
ncbi:MAG: DNA alkylation repair protein [Micrococcales bacterium]|nr:DNA alkylation repair protein [Micrococcales bacterium]